MSSQSSFASTRLQDNTTTFTPPHTKRIPLVEMIHGIPISDDYRWLEAESNADVIEWTRSQDDATRAYIRKRYPEITNLRKEITQLYDRDITYPPFYKADREFFYRRNKGDKYARVYTRYLGKEVLIFDVNMFDPTGETSLSGFTLDKTAERVAIGVQKKGSELTDYLLIDTKTGKELFSLIKGVSGFSWAKEKTQCYITPRTKELVDAQKPLPTYRHTLGTPHSNDVLLLTSDDAKIFNNVYDSEDADVTVYSQGDFYSITLKITKTNSNQPLRTIYSSDKFQAFPTFRGNRLYWLSNENAPNSKILLSTADNPEYTSARTLIAEGETVIQDFEITSDWLLVIDKKDVLSRITVYTLDGVFVRTLVLPDVANVGTVSYHKESNSVYVSLNTFTSPSKLYKLDGKTLEWQFVYQDSPPVDMSNIEAQVNYIPTKDGRKIPVFVVHKKGMVLDGSNPTLIQGYGGFNLGIQPSFVSYASSFLQRGGVWVNAGIRGGNEYGEMWHKEGMMANKQNTFDDFATVAQWLIDKKITNSQKLVAQGGSNGGLLMGAMATQHPTLFKAIVCQVPLLDMIRYHKFLIARFWIPEYGDPDIKDDFEIIRKYSPYHAINSTINLPTMLVSAGAYDVRVDPLHAKKFVAAAQNNPSQTNPIMLSIDYESGHGSGKSVQNAINDMLFNWSFIMGELGMK